MNYLFKRPKRNQVKISTDFNGSFAVISFGAWFPCFLFAPGLKCWHLNKIRNLAANWGLLIIISWEFHFLTSSHLKFDSASVIFWGSTRFLVFQLGLCEENDHIIGYYKTIKLTALSPVTLTTSWWRAIPLTDELSSSCRRVAIAMQPYRRDLYLHTLKTTMFYLCNIYVIYVDKKSQQQQQEEPTTTEKSRTRTSWTISRSPWACYVNVRTVYPTILPSVCICVCKIWKMWAKDFQRLNNKKNQRWN